MIHKLKTKIWSSKLRIRTGEVVQHKNGFYSNKTGINSEPEMNSNSNWLYIGEVEKDGSFILRSGENLTEQEIIHLQEIIGIGDLPSNLLTHDFEREIGNGFTKTQSDSRYYKKVEINEVNYDYLLNIRGESVDPNSFGKNIANSNLTSVAGAGMTLGAPYTWATNGQPFSITGLPDKSADAAFDRIRVQNSLGQEAMVTNAYVLLKNTFGQMTASQSLELGQLLNGGVGSAGAMSVNLISPPVIEKINSNEYIMLRGANLNLNATSKKIEILNATTQAVFATIPDNQIQMYSDGLSLVFYYNFKDFTVGDFLIRLTSGSKVYLTTLTLKIVNDIVQKDLSLLNWSVLYDEASSNSGNNVFGNTSISIQTVGVGVEGVSSNTAVAIKSGEIFAQGEDFYLELGINLSNQYNNMRYDNYISFIGVGYSSSNLNLVNLSLISSSFSYYHNSGQSVTYLYNNNILAKTNTVVATNEIVTIIKTGNLFRMIIGSVNYSTILSNNSGYSIFLSLVNRASVQTTQVQIIKAYTFN